MCKTLLQFDRVYRWGGVRDHGKENALSIEGGTKYKNDHLQ